MNAPYLSIIVPCFNEEGSLPHLHERLNAAVLPYRAHGVEIILVNDGSHDGTWNLIEALSTKDEAIVGIKFSRNFGHQMALSCGLDYARGERVLIIDADLQDPPEVLNEMMQRMDQGFDVVYGQRKSRQGETAFKKLSAWLFYRVLNRLSDVKIPVDTGDFRLMSRRVVDTLKTLPERVRFTRGLVSWLGFRQTAVHYVRDARHAGQTHYSLKAMFRYANEGLTSFSTRPLQLAIWMGIGMMIASLLLLIYVFTSWLFFDVVRGWTSLAAIFLLSQAFLWLMLGIIGNYLAVIFRETKARPLYIVDEVISRR